MSEEAIIIWDPKAEIATIGTFAMIATAEHRQAFIRRCLETARPPSRPLWERDTHAITAYLDACLAEGIQLNVDLNSAVRLITNAGTTPDDCAQPAKKANRYA